jgi:hypothetical protein
MEYRNIGIYGRNTLLRTDCDGWIDGRDRSNPILENAQKGTNGTNALTAKACYSTLSAFLFLDVECCRVGHC